MGENEYDSMKQNKSTVFPGGEGDGKATGTVYGFPTESYELKVTPAQRRNMQLQAAMSSEDKEDDIFNARTLLATFVGFTTSHGITHIYNATGKMKKVVWLILSVASLVFLSFHLWYLMTGYLTFSVITNTNVVEMRSMDFPAVTLCNANGVKQSNVPASLLGIVNSRKSRALNGSDSSRSNKGTLRSLAEVISKMNTSEKVALGYSQDDLVIFCTFNGENCGDDFYSFFDSTYGNCYTFNSGKTTLRKSRFAGQNNGLTLVVNIGVYDYLPFLTEEAGIRVVIHDQKVMPFPHRDGVSASPGQVNNLAVKKFVAERLDGKYGNCTKSTMNTENMYFQPYNVSYSQWACLRTCYQKELANKCRCYDPDLPYDEGSSVFSGLNSARGPCLSANNTNAQCTKTATDNFADRTLQCTHCHQPCTENSFESSLSTSSFPATSYIGDFLNLLNLTHLELVTNLQTRYGRGALHTALQGNFLKLNVFYQSMTYTVNQQVASYDDFQFVSDLGGAFGLWIGWSVLTIFEFMELTLDLFVYLCYRSPACKNRK